MEFVGENCYICSTPSDKLFYCPRIKSSVLLWLEALGIDKKNACAAAATLKLCRKHFHASDFINSEQNQLNRSAIPSLCLGNQGSSPVFPSTSLMTDVSDIPINQPSTAVFPSSSWIETPRASTSTGVIDLPINSTTLEKSQYKSQSNASVVKETPLIPTVSEKSRKSHLIFIRQLQKMMPKTPRTKKFLNILKSKLEHICTLKRVCVENEQDLKELFIRSKKYADIVFKDLSAKNQLLLISQLCVKDVATSGRQWTVDEKLTCLLFWKRYPKVYRLLRKLIVLPSINCLMTVLRLIPLRPGVHDCIRSHLKNMVRNLWKTEKFCSLMFDEMSIREGLSFDQKTDRITGHVDMGTGLKGKEYANSVIVFMLQGLERNWKQSIAYYFCRNLTSDHLSRMIMEVIRKVYSIGLRVVCTVCDMKNNNVKALNSLKSKKEDHFFYFKGKTIFTMFNPPSLLISTRNLLYKYNIHCEFSLKGTSYIGEARWDDIRTAYEQDLLNLVARMLEKLTEAHLAPVNKNTMMAANVLSYKVASTISAHIQHGCLPDTAAVTAIFVNTVDSLFDSFNGTRLTPKDWKELKCYVSKTSKHMRFWEETESAINSWVYLDKSGQPFTPSSKTGWIITLRAIRGIWKYLKTKGLCHLRTRNFNLDPLEHLFYLIRSCSGGNNRPTAEQFESAYKLYVNNNIKKFEVSHPVRLFETPYSILYEKELKFLSDFRPFFQNSASKQDVCKQNTVAEELRDFSTTVFPTVESAACSERHILSVAYVANFIVKRILEKQNCNSCIKSLMSDCTDSLCNRFFELKDYKGDETSFICPTEDIVTAVGNAITIVEKMLPDIFNTADIFKQLSTVINTAVDFSFLCTTHKEIMRSCIVKGVCFISVPWYCKREMRRLVDRNRANKQKCKRT